MHALIASAASTVAAWILLGPLAAVVVTVTGARLLGVRRGWLQLAVAGVVGWTAGVLAAGDLSGWKWDSAGMAVASLGFGTICTMVVALARCPNRAGGMFVKLGQVASTRADLLPAEGCDELAHLRSATQH